LAKRCATQSDRLDAVSFRESFGYRSGTYRGFTKRLSGGEQAHQADAHDAQALRRFAVSRHRAAYAPKRVQPQTGYTE